VNSPLPFLAAFGQDQRRGKLTQAVTLISLTVARADSTSHASYTLLYSRWKLAVG
jgi:hypothetical protein